MPDAPKTVRLKVSRPKPSKAITVEIDGQDYARLFTSLTVDLTTRYPFTLATAELFLPYFEHDGQAVVRLSAEQRELLVAVGWTPPAEP